MRNALYEFERLLDSGLSEADFEATRGYLINYSKLWAQTLASRLGYLMDSAYYGIPPFIDEIESRLARVERSDVLEAVARHLQSDDFQAVIIVADAAGLKQALEAEAPSSMYYANPVSQEVTGSDPAIEAIRVEVDSLTIVPVGRFFE
jgi:zinc protease